MSRVLSIEQISSTIVAQHLCTSGLKPMRSCDSRQDHLERARGEIGDAQEPGCRDGGFVGVRSIIEQSHVPVGFFLVLVRITAIPRYRPLHEKGLKRLP